jgi:hypothetical protein
MQLLIDFIYILCLLFSDMSGNADRVYAGINSRFACSIISAN